ncbi:MAG: oligopeptide/dipeptide ABC transporter ATP-binding protein [Hyphomicrobiales bacterium]
MSDNILLKARNLHVTFKTRRPGAMPWGKSLALRAVNGVDFDLKAGETLGIVGESGCGKSTLARAVVRLVPATGRVVWGNGVDLLSLSAKEMLRYRSQIQLIFQDPLASLDPRMQVGDIIAEPLITHNKTMSRVEVRKYVRDMMARVGLLPDQISRYPHEFSGGQCQRIAIARALIVRPKLIICDEPVSALDVSIRAQAINLLRELQREFGLSIMFITHDLSVARYISTRLIVLYLGRIMEIAPSDALYKRPHHPYTQALLRSVPIPDPDIERNKKTAPLIGELPSPLHPPSGCVFRTRCPRARPLCAQKRPVLAAVTAGTEEHRVACHFPGPEPQG